MSKYKLFLSHSSMDFDTVNAFVNFMFKIGLNENDIVCSSVPSTKIPVGEDIYEYLNTLIADESIYTIYFLSDNYYSSPICLNEMGATWLKKTGSLCLLLAGFDFKDIQGVVSKNKVGIKLGVCDGMTKASFNEFKNIIEDLFEIQISYTKWELARDEFLNASIENTRKFNMTFCRSYCIGDLENEGCKIIKKDSNRYTIKARIDFNETDSKLASIVFFSGKKDFTSYFINRKSLCFEAYADEGIGCVDVELKIDNVDVIYEILLDSDEKSFHIPLIQFCDELSYWKNVSEIKFVLHRKKVSKCGNLIVKNLRIE